MRCQQNRKKDIFRSFIAILFHTIGMNGITGKTNGLYPASG
jgi:hypothetical protein